MTMLSRAELEASCATRIPGVIRPSAVQGIQRIRRFVADAWNGVSTSPIRSKPRDLVVLGLDAISYDLAADVFTPDVLFPLTSTFPSTSCVAWLTAMSGLDPSEHGIPGVVYYDPRAGGLFHVFRDVAWGAPHHGLSAGQVAIGPWSTFFDDIENARAFLAPSDLDYWPSRWRDELFRSGRRVPGNLDARGIRYDPARTVDLAAAAVDSVLEVNTFVFAVLNFDDYVHVNGYSRELRSALRRLENRIARWTAEGATVVGVADHGMVPNHVSADIFIAFEELTRSDLCRFEAGGAGRVRWAYPKPGAKDQVRQSLEAIVGDSALVLDRAQAIANGLFIDCPLIERSIGELVVLATGSKFPVPDPSYIFEHGSATAEEMIVPFMVWGNG